MKQQIFETRRRAEDLLKEAVSIWASTDSAEALEGIEKDPVFGLLIGALAHQYNVMDGDIESLKQEVVEEYASTIVPYGAGGPTPSTVAVGLQPISSAPEVTLDTTSAFTLEGTSFRFSPVFRTRVLNAGVKSVKRVDGRRWNVELRFPQNVSDLSGFSFALKNPAFKNLKVFIGDRELPVARPWDISRLPLSRHFSLDAMLYNSSLIYNASNLCLDMAVGTGTQIFFFDKADYSKCIPFDSEKVTLTFEFFGISADFNFEPSSIVLNATILANVDVATATISKGTPIVKLSGTGTRQFMHLVSPSAEQIYGKTAVTVRRINADRFNAASLVRLLQTVLHRFASDFHAFEVLHDMNEDRVMSNLYSLVEKMSAKAGQTPERNISGLYLTFRDGIGIMDSEEPVSVDIDYLTTDGAFVNPHLSDKISFKQPAMLDQGSLQILSQPTLGNDTLHEDKDLLAMSRYYMVTADRIVTPADVKLFCRTQLLTRFGIEGNTIKGIRIDHVADPLEESGYVLQVTISLQGTSFVKRSLEGRLVQVESAFEKMMDVRRTFFYPIKVSIIIEEKE